MNNISDKTKFLLKASASVVVLGLSFYGGYSYSGKVTSGVFSAELENNKTVATVNGIPVYEAELTAINGGRIPTPVEKMQLLDGYINTVILAQNFKSEDMDPLSRVMIDRQTKAQSKLSSMQRVALKDITKEQIEKYYNQNMSAEAFNRYKLSYYLTQSEEDAQAVLGEMSRGSFQKLQQIKVGDETSIPASLIPYGAAGIVTKMSPGQYTTAPLFTRDGWLIIKVDAKEVGQKPLLQDISSDIKTLLAQQTVQEKVAKLREKAEIKIK